MKKSVWTAGCLVLVVASPSAQVSPQKTNDSQNEAIELLRRTIAEQQNHPNQIIRAAASATNNGAASGRRAELERQYLHKRIAEEYAQLERLQGVKQNHMQESRPRPQIKVQESA